MTMIHYKLLTPGPLTTTDTVKAAMLVDHCTWDDDYKVITTGIIKNLLQLANVSEAAYTAVLMQGSGTFGVESVLTSSVGQADHLLILANGVYGLRMAEIAQHAQLSYDVLEFPYNQVPDAQVVAEFLDSHPEITHLAMVHCETTTGILNDIQAISQVVKNRQLTFIVDAMSSFGGISIDVTGLNIDFLISSANKCIQGVPGFSFIIAKKEAMLATKGKANSLSLDLYEQWETMSKDGKWRFTSPTHVVIAFEQALQELAKEGGVAARHARYQANMTRLLALFKANGLLAYVPEENQSPIIATFHLPSQEIDFKEMYNFIKAEGYAIYPGKLLDLNTFRVGVIGEIYQADIARVSDIFETYLADKKIEG
ncbi:2-aminoethylphosphonate--pyruvate transaminase [Bacilli bacterium]|nr:2-aminoethylphosphonate--pyruvate transaminase [Bacilli bacterium]GHU40798.1 2-aminoethylphosphonate--pyruvate transaminase [Bacilli bacterium]GHU45106.1 2-aminoethylphosphonate--pyruvate transaminase [Bacilli bacterium]